MLVVHFRILLSQEGRQRFGELIFGSDAFLEQLFFPSGKRPSEMTPEDLRALAQTLDALVDRYGEDHIRAMLHELAEMTAESIRARLPKNVE